MKNGKRMMVEQKLGVLMISVLWALVVIVPLWIALSLGRSTAPVFLFGVIFGSFVSVAGYLIAFEPPENWVTTRQYYYWFFPLIYFLLMMGSMKFVGLIERGGEEYLILEKPNGKILTLIKGKRFNYSEVVRAVFPRYFSAAGNGSTPDFKGAGPDFIVQGRILNADFEIPPDEQSIKTLFHRFGNEHRLKQAIKEEIGRSVIEAVSRMTVKQRLALRTLDLKWERPLNVFQGTKADPVFFGPNRDTVRVALSVSIKPSPSHRIITVH